MRPDSLPVLALLACLGGCAEPLMGPGHMRTEVMALSTAAGSSTNTAVDMPSAGPLASPSGGGIALLAPLTGVDAAIGPSLVNAARLGLGTGTVPPLDVIDTGSTPRGAAAAAEQAIGAGDRLILGPLTARETAEVAPIAAAAHVEVLAFTSDTAVAGPALWTLGITPAQQVEALVRAADTAGRGRFAGLLPLDPLGEAMDRALRAAEPSAPVRLYADFTGMSEAARALSDYAARRGPVDARIKRLAASHDAADRAEAARLARLPVPPPPFSALMIAETGAGLGELGSLLPYYDVTPGPVLILGPGLWATNPAAVARAGFSGALYAAPDPAAGQDFRDRYQLAFGSLPPPLAAIAFDAGGVTRLATETGALDPSALTNPAGFGGADGVLALQPGGSVRRALAVFEVTPEGARMIRPAPQALSAPGL
ncbi:MAG: ABC transporter substrate-binding protein [Proteobacteria bacterium]|nr:ABC transporter substrate-binding protein [Pseudomonadota bacterium]